jgi:hypothetical protein
MPRQSADCALKQASFCRGGGDCWICQCTSSIGRAF